jgi:hypothetical protein
LNLIRQVNPGIQVVLFTASNDGLILDEIHDREVLGYVKKDSPADRYEASLSSFKKLKKLIEKAVSRRYLKDIYQTEKRVLSLLNLHKINEYTELSENVSAVFTILNSNLPQPFTFAMYTIFKCIELINDHFIDDRNNGAEKQAFWLENRKRANIQYVTTENKINIILKEKLDLHDRGIHDEIRRLVCCRNNLIHPGKLSQRCKQDFIKRPEYQHIVEWFSMLADILKRLDSKLAGQ